MKFREELSRIFNKWSTNYFTDANTRLQKYSTNNQQIIGLRIWDPTAGCGRAGPASALAESCGPPGLRLTSKATSWKTWTWSEPESLTTDSELKSVRVRRRGPCCNVRVTGMRRRAVQPGLLALPHRGTVTGLSCQWHHHRVIRVRATDRDRRVRRPAAKRASRVIMPAAQRSVRSAVPVRPVTLSHGGLGSSESSPRPSPLTSNRGRGQLRPGSGQELQWNHPNFDWALKLTGKWRTHIPCSALDRVPPAGPDRSPSHSGSAAWAQWHY